MRSESPSADARYLTFLFRACNKLMDALASLSKTHSRDAELNEQTARCLRNLCSENAFRHLLAGESKRSERSGHRSQLILIYCADAQGSTLRLTPKTVEKVTGLLVKNIRDTDYIGWYQEDRIIGAVLTGMKPNSNIEESVRFGIRLEEILRRGLANRDSARIQIKACRQERIREFEWKE